MLLSFSEYEKDGIKYREYSIDEGDHIVTIKEEWKPKSGRKLKIPFRNQGKWVELLRQELPKEE